MPAAWRLHRDGVTKAEGTAPHARCPSPSRSFGERTQLNSVYTVKIGTLPFQGGTEQCRRAPLPPGPAISKPSPNPGRRLEEVFGLKLEVGLRAVARSIAPSIALSIDRRGKATTSRKLKMQIASSSTPAVTRLHQTARRIDAGCRTAQQPLGFPSASEGRLLPAFLRLPTAFRIRRSRRLGGIRVGRQTRMGAQELVAERRVACRRRRTKWTKPEEDETQ